MSHSNQQKSPFLLVKLTYLNSLLDSIFTQMFLTFMQHLIWQTLFSCLPHPDTWFRESRIQPYPSRANATR